MKARSKTVNEKRLRQFFHTKMHIKLPPPFPLPSLAPQLPIVRPPWRRKRGANYQRPNFKHT